MYHKTPPIKRNPLSPYPCRFCHHPFTPDELLARYGKRSPLYKNHFCTNECAANHVKYRMQRFADSIKKVATAFEKFANSFPPGGIITTPVDANERIIEICNKNKINLLLTIHHKKMNQ